MFSQADSETRVRLPKLCLNCVTICILHDGYALHFGDPPRTMYTPVVIGRSPRVIDMLHTRNLTMVVDGACR